ncbi:hypothetical protein QOZ80_5BG0423190 [Eleusine coracana subsp. coracana]|nr:hypothetical protein QOZ80_5BG0423190 [Eleusine coracana subsp. coracana]
MLWANDSVFNSIVWRFSDSWHHITTTNMIADMIRDLEYHLEEESKSLQNNSQRYMFLLNNFDFIEEKLNEIHFAPPRMFGKDQKVGIYMRRYLAVSWEPVLSCLQSDGGTTTSCLFPSKQCSPLEKFQSMLEATCKAQMFWKVPNPKLRQRLREAIIGKVIGPYNDYGEAQPEPKKHYDVLPINCSSSSSEGLNGMLNQLFEGV